MYLVHSLRAAVYRRSCRPSYSQQSKARTLSMICSFFRSPPLLYRWQRQPRGPPGARSAMTDFAFSNPILLILKGNSEVTSVVREPKPLKLLKATSPVGGRVPFGDPSHPSPRRCEPINLPDLEAHPPAAVLKYALTLARSALPCAVSP